MLQNWALGPFGGQVVNPLSSLVSSTPPQVIQLLQTIPQQLQQLQQTEFVRQQQLQQIQQLIQYVAYQLQAQGQLQAPQASLGAFGLGQSYQSVGAGIPSAFSTPPLHVM